MRGGRERSFKAATDARIRYEQAKGMLTLLETEGLRRALVIQAEENVGRLEVGTESLLRLQEELAPVEAAVRMMLAQYTPEVGLLEDRQRVIDATVKECTGGKSDGS